MVKIPAMRKILIVLFVVMVVSLSATAADQFDEIRCGADIPKTLHGKRDSNQRVVVLEQHHKDLGLKNLGGTEISDDLFLASWEICGSEYELLIRTKTSLIRDVLLFPSHSAATPMFIGTCQQGGKELPGTMIAVLNNGNGYNPRETKMARAKLKATAAWKIDTLNEKFAKQSAEGFECPMAGIVTQDGGS